MKLSQKEVQHFYLRAGFGAPISEVKSHVGLTPTQLLSQQFESSFQNRPVEIASEFSIENGMAMSTEERRMMRKVGRQEVVELNTRWLKEMVQSPATVKEKMAFFWHDHFACRSRNPVFMQAYLDGIRSNSLGNFGDLLRAVSKTPAMLQYLNNQQNRKSAPNENFAREVMELFTLGRDKEYTEKDISEAARAFTGWGFDRYGKFTNRTQFHDRGNKTVLGKTGKFDGDDILDLLLEEKQTAHYIAQKWVAFFMNAQGNKSLESKVANELYQSNYDIKTGLYALFTAPEFYAKENMGCRIKSPIELIVSMQRQMDVTIESANSLIFLQKMMGQVLFDPPNVSGWPDGKDWVDSSTLLFRMNLPQLIFKAAVIQNSPGESFDDNDQFRLSGRLRRLETSFDLASLENAFSSASELKDFLLQVDDGDSTGIPIEFLDQVVYCTSKPEYQLC